MIHVCYGLHDLDGHYSKFCGTSIVSMFENTNESVTVHILHDDTLTLDNRDKFIYLTGRYDQTIKFYNVEIVAAARYNKIQQSAPRTHGFNLYTIGSLYRLLIHEVLPVDIDKIIYIDAGDTIVNLDIKVLWNLDVTNYPFAADTAQAFRKMRPNLQLDDLRFLLCKHGFVKPENYFSTGLLVIDDSAFDQCR